jgi:predicted DNA-binding antitoxin AbrB/MazE fold protein
MPQSRKTHPTEETLKAVNENGELRPLERLRLKEQSQVLVTVHGEPQWQEEFNRLIRKMRARTRAIPQELIEVEVTQARAEVKAKRRAARRSAWHERLGLRLPQADRTARAGGQEMATGQFQGGHFFRRTRWNRRSPYPSTIDVEI